MKKCYVKGRSGKYRRKWLKVWRVYNLLSGVDFWFWIDFFYFLYSMENSNQKPQIQKLSPSIKNKKKNLIHKFSFKLHNWINVVLSTQKSSREAYLCISCSHSSHFLLSWHCCHLDFIIFNFTRILFSIFFHIHFWTIYPTFFIVRKNLSFKCLQ